MYPLINSVRMLLYFQMFSDCKETSYKTDSHSQKNSYWQKCSIYLCDRKEINDILKKMEPLKNIVNCLLIYQVQNSKWNHSSDCSDEQSFKHERCSAKSIAPIYFIIAISSLLTVIPMVTVLLIRKIDTANRIPIMATDT